jgi:hypothetical protein
MSEAKPFADAVKAASQMTDAEIRKARVAQKASFARAIKDGAEAAARKWAADNGVMVEVIGFENLWIQFMVREYLFGPPRFFEVAISEHQ